MADIIDGLFIKCLSVYCLWSITVNIWGNLKTLPIVVHLSSMYSVLLFTEVVCTVCPPSVSASPLLPVGSFQSQSVWKDSAVWKDTDT